MNIEIERKYLIDDFDIEMAYHSIQIKQGYLFSADAKVMRVRTYNDKAYVALKFRLGPINRAEFEYEIPFEDAEYMLESCCNGHVLEKTRYLVRYEGKKWEVDVFEGKNKGLILAEIELESETEEYKIPPFVGREVTGERAYSNHNLSKI